MAARYSKIFFEASVNKYLTAVYNIILTMDFSLSMATLRVLKGWNFLF